jgi:hypothetical protein
MDSSHLRTIHSSIRIVRIGLNPTKGLVTEKVDHLQMKVEGWVQTVSRCEREMKLGEAV